VLALSQPELSSKVSVIASHADRLGVSLVDESVYKRFRCLEPSLTSCVDELVDSSSARTFYVAALLDGVPIAVTSLVVRVNPQHPAGAMAYGRIDLVIVDPRFRGFRIGRLLVTAALLHLLDRCGGQLYSVSCLAAHPAMERILDELGFVRSQRSKKNYVHEELKLDTINRAKLLEDLAYRLGESFRQARFRIRQEQNSSRS